MTRADFTPLLVILRKHPFCVVSTLLTVILAVASWFLWGKVSELEALHQVRSQEGENMMATLVSGPPLRQELASVREYTRRIESNLVIEDNLAENLWYFYKLEEQTKARLPELRQLNASLPESGALYKRVPYSLKVTGTYAQVSTFLHALETGPRLAHISSYSFRRRDAAGAALIALDLSVELLGKK